MKTNKVGMITASVLISLLLIIVLVDYFVNKNKEVPPYEHGKIMSITEYRRIRTVDEEASIHFCVYRRGKGYIFSYEKLSSTDETGKQVFKLSKRDGELLMNQDFHDLLEIQGGGGCFPSFVYIFEFQDGTEQKVYAFDWRIHSYFDGCEEAFINEDT